MKRLFSLLLASILFCTAIFPASAAVSDPVEPCFDYIRSTAETFTIDETTGIAYCYARCYTGREDVTIKIIGTLQQYNSGTWNYINSWTQTGTLYAIMDRQWAVYSGYIYRFFVHVYIYDTEGNLLETDTLSRTYNYF